MKQLFRENLKRPWLRRALLLEALILAVMIAACLKPRLTLNFTPENMYLTQETWEDAVSVYEEPAEGYRFLCGERSRGRNLLETEMFRLHPGAYRVWISYSAAPAGDADMAALSLYSGANGMYTNFTDLPLRSDKYELEQAMQVWSPFAVDDLMFKITGTAPGELSVYQIHVQEVMKYRYLMVVCAALMFALADAVILKFQRGSAGEKGILYTLGILCGFLMLPFVSKFTFLGHDGHFHINRIICLADELRMGSRFPFLYTTALNGYGYANPIFYGQTFLYLPAILYSCGVDLTIAYNVYVIFVSLLTCFIMYYASGQIFEKKTTALLAAALYSLSAVRLTNIFVRSAVGEFTAQAFLPLIVLGFYRVYSCKETDRITLNAYWPIIAGLTCVLLSHALSFVMCAMVIVLFCIASWKKTFQKARFIALCKAAGITLLLNLSTLVPFLDSYRMELDVKTRVNHIQSTGAELLQILNPVVNGYRALGEWGKLGGEMSYAIGLPIVIGFILYGAYRIYTSDHREGIDSCPASEKTGGITKLIQWSFGLSAGAILLSTSDIPYDALDCLPKGLYGILTVYQFPWRWLVFGTLFGVFGTAGVLERTSYISGKRYAYIAAVTVTVFSMVMNAGQIYADQLWTGMPNQCVNNSYYYNMEIGAGEYLPVGTNPLMCGSREVIYNGDNLELLDYRFEGGKTSLYVRNHSESAETVELPLLSYAGYLAYEESGTELRVSSGKNNRVAVDIPGKYAGQITVAYHVRRLWKAAMGLSCVTLFLILGYGYMQIRKRRKTR